MKIILRQDIRKVSKRSVWLKSLIVGLCSIIIPSVSSANGGGILFGIAVLYFWFYVSFPFALAFVLFLFIAIAILRKIGLTAFYSTVISGVCLYALLVVLDLTLPYAINIYGKLYLGTIFLGLEALIIALLGFFVLKLFHREAMKSSLILACLTFVGILIFHYVFVFSTQQITRALGSCQIIPSAIARAQCVDQIARESYLGKYKNNTEEVVRVCNQITDYPDQKIPAWIRIEDLDNSVEYFSGARKRSQCVTTFASRLEDVNICDLSSNSVERDGCVLSTAIYILNDPSVCNSITSFEKREECFGAFGKRASKNPLICQQISSALDRGTCLSDVAIAKRDVSLCKQIEPTADHLDEVVKYLDVNQPDYSYPTDYHDGCITKIAIINQNPRLCDSIIEKAITGTNLKKWCAEKATDSKQQQIYIERYPPEYNLK